MVRITDTRDGDFLNLKPGYTSHKYGGGVRLQWDAEGMQFDQYTAELLLCGLIPLQFPNVPGARFKIVV